jgi:hypothetical protein
MPLSSNTIIQSFYTISETSRAIPLSSNAITRLYEKKAGFCEKFPRLHEKKAEFCEKFPRLYVRKAGLYEKFPDLCFGLLVTCNQDTFTAYSLERKLHP